VRKLAGYLACNPDRIVVIGRERLRQLLHAHHISFQRTRTWKQSHHPDFDAKLDRIEAVTTAFPDRCFAFDQFGPLSIRPCHGTCWAPRTRPARLPATYHRTHGIRYFHGCYSLADDQLWGVVHKRKGADHTLAAFKTIRAARPDGATIYVICDNLSANKTPTIRTWARRNKVELCLTPDQRLLGQPDRAAVRTAANVHHGRLEPVQPPSAHPRPAGIPALAQHPRPPPPGTRRATPRTRPHPQRTSTTLGTPPTESRLTLKPGKRSWSAH
jgi:hypothetical protein